MTNKIIIGLSGRIASGKETAGKWLMKKTRADKVRFSDPLRQTLDLFSIPQSRENMQSLSTFLRQTYDEECIAKAIFKITMQSPSPVSIIDGVRRMADIKTFCDLDNFYLIFINTEQKIRYERMVARGENPGETEMTYDDFLQKDDAESEQQIEGLKKDANFIIDNNGSLDELEKQLEDVLEKIKKEG